LRGQPWKNHRGLRQPGRSPCGREPPVFFKKGGLNTLRLLWAESIQETFGKVFIEFQNYARDVTDEKGTAHIDLWVDSIPISHRAELYHRLRYASRRPHADLFNFFGMVENGSQRQPDKA